MVGSDEMTPKAKVDEFRTFINDTLNEIARGVSSEDLEDVAPTVFNLMDEKDFINTFKNAFLKVTQLNIDSMWKQYNVAEKITKLDEMKREYSKLQNREVSMSTPPDEPLPLTMKKFYLFEVKQQLENVINGTKHKTEETLKETERVKNLLKAQEHKMGEQKKNITKDIYEMNNKLN